MGKNKNNSSTKVVNKNVTKSHEPIAKVCTGNSIENNGKTAKTNVKTRSSVKRSNLATAADQQPLPKHHKSEGTNKVCANSEQNQDPPSVENTKGGNNLDGKEVIVGTAKSLINSIKNGRLGKCKEAKVVQDSAKPGSSKERETSTTIMPEHDSVRVGVDSSEENEYQSSDDDLDCSSTDSGELSDSEGSDNGGESNESEQDFSDSASTDSELQEDDPRVQRLLERVRREDQEKRKMKRQEKKETKRLKRSEKMKRISKKRPTNNGKQGRVISKIIKSPSDTTIYAPALFKTKQDTNVYNTPKSLINNNKISDFVERLRREQHNTDGDEEDMSEDGNIDEDQDSIQARTQAEKLVIEAEKFKASITPPKGNNTEKLNDNAIDKSNLSDSISELISLLRNQTEVSSRADNDDDFMHVTCHIDSNLRDKIGRGEFIELERLLPKNRSQIMNTNGNSEIQIVKRDGSKYIIPDSAGKDNKINGVRRWEQAFRVYAAVYSEINPQRAPEIWQYVHVINTASVSYTWENVAYYDYTFRQLMERKPHRSWAKIYTQMWNLAMTDHVHKFTQNNGGTKHDSPKDRYCWRFNKGRCSKWNCKFEHRCKVKDCGSYSHGASQCNKKKNFKQGSQKSTDKKDSH